MWMFGCVKVPLRFRGGVGVVVGSRVRHVRMSVIGRVYACACVCGVGGVTRRTRRHPYLISGVAKARERFLSPPGHFVDAVHLG